MKPFRFVAICFPVFLALVALPLVAGELIADIPLETPPPPIDEVLEPVGDAQASEEVTPGQVAASLIALAVMAAVIVTYSNLFRRRLARGTWVVEMPRADRLSRQGLVHLIVAAAAALILSSVAVVAAKRFGVPIKHPTADELTFEGQAAGMVGSLAAVVVSTLMFTAWQAREGWRLWSTKHLFGDMRLGLWALLVAYPIVVAIAFVATQVTQVEYNHPILDALSPDLRTVLITYFVTAVAAPVVEEFIFRGLLQGFLQNLVQGPWTLANILFGVANERQPTSIEENLLASEDPSHTAGIEINERPPMIDGTSPGRGQLPAARSAVSCWLPIVITGVIFGGLHWEYGVSAVPLSFFGIWLGYLRWRTERLWPSVVTHAVFNAMAITIALLGEQPQ